MRRALNTVNYKVILRYNSAIPYPFKHEIDWIWKVILQRDVWAILFTEWIQCCCVLIDLVYSLNILFSVVNDITFLLLVYLEGTHFLPISRNREVLYTYNLLYIFAGLSKRHNIANKPSCIKPIIFFFSLESS